MQQCPAEESRLLLANGRVARGNRRKSEKTCICWGADVTALRFKTVVPLFQFCVEGLFQKFADSGKLQTPRHLLKTSPLPGCKRNRFMEF